MQYIADSVTSVSQKPTKMISDWMTDQIAPDYWVPNSQITVSTDMLLLSLVNCVVLSVQYFI